MPEYAPFLDSTPLRRDPAALRGQLERDGYLYLCGVLPTLDVDDVRRQVLAVADDAGWLLPAADPHTSPTADPKAAVWDPDPAYREVHRRMWTQRPVHALMHHPALLAVITALIRTDDVLVHPRKVLRAVHPRPAPAARDGGWHQDFPEIQGTRNTLTVWTPLATAGPGTGALAIVPGSHRAGTLPLRLAPTAVGWEADIHPAVAHTGLVQPGDVLVFTAHTVHRGTPNTGNGLRLSLDARYQPASEPITETCLELRDEKYGWDTVYACWPHGADDPLAHYWRSRRLDVRPYDTRFDEWRTAAALEAGERRDPVARRALQLAAAYDTLETAAKAAVLTQGLPGRAAPDT